MLCRYAALVVFCVPRLKVCVDSCVRFDCGSLADHDLVIFSVYVLVAFTD